MSEEASGARGRVRGGDLSEMNGTAGGSIGNSRTNSGRLRLPNRI